MNEYIVMFWGTSGHHGVVFTSYEEAMRYLYTVDDWYHVTISLNGKTMYEASRPFVVLDGRLLFDAFTGEAFYVPLAFNTLEEAKKFASLQDHEVNICELRNSMDYLYLKERTLS